MKRLLMILVPVFLLAGGGGFAYTHMKQPAAHAAAHPKAVANTATAALPAATINLSGDDGFQYLEIQVAVVMQGSETSDAMSKLVDDRKAALLDALNKAIEGQRFTSMRTNEGIETLSTTLESKFSEILAPALVVRVYFEQFVAD
jgi:flagellar basal body-associated protein FliL